LFVRRVAFARRSWGLGGLALGISDHRWTGPAG